MKKHRVDHIKYEPPETPPGKLRMGDNFSIRFPIQEKSAEGFIGQLNAYIEEAYQRGLQDGAEPSHRSTKNSQNDKQIQHVYEQDGVLKVASIHPTIITPQDVVNLNSMNQLVEQINMMIDRAEERGCVKGYRACLNDKSPDEPLEDSDGKHIQYAYQDGNCIMVSGVYQNTNIPQMINGCKWNYNNANLYVRQINKMIDRAKRRGHQRGYTEGFVNGSTRSIGDKKI